MKKNDGGGDVSYPMSDDGGGKTFPKNGGVKTFPMNDDEKIFPMNDDEKSFPMNDGGKISSEHSRGGWHRLAALLKHYCFLPCLCPLLILHR